MRDILQKMIDNSNIINRFMDAEHLRHDDLYELFFECFCSYMEVFKERLKYGRHFKQVLTSYREIPAFMESSARVITNRMFLNHRMHKWFAYRFWKEIDKQVSDGKVSKNDLLVSLTFINAIPTKSLMEKILNDTEKGAVVVSVPGAKKTAGGKTARVTEEA